MHPLLLEEIDESHLALEALHELVPLSLQCPNLLAEGVHTFSCIGDGALAALLFGSELLPQGVCLLRFATEADLEQMPLPILAMHCIAVLSGLSFGRSCVVCGLPGPVPKMFRFIDRAAPRSLTGVESLFQTLHFGSRFAGHCRDLPQLLGRPRLSLC